MDPFFARDNIHDSTCDDDAPLDLDVEDAFGEHTIEYWVRHGNRLVPATEDDIARIRAWESERIGEALVARWEREHRLRWPHRVLLVVRLALRRLAAWWPGRVAPPTAPPAQASSQTTTPSLREVER